MLIIICVIAKFQFLVQRTQSRKFTFYLHLDVKISWEFIHHGSCFFIIIWSIGNLLRISDLMLIPNNWKHVFVLLHEKNRKIHYIWKWSFEVEIFFFCRIHIQIPPTGYIGLILRSTAVATASRSTFEGTMRVLCSYCMCSSFSTCCHSSVRVPS